MKNTDRKFWWKIEWLILLEENEKKHPFLSKREMEKKLFNSNFYFSFAGKHSRPIPFLVKLVGAENIF